MSIPFTWTKDRAVGGYSHFCAGNEQYDVGSSLDCKQIAILGEAWG
jgi:hypothetical protein